MASVAILSKVATKDLTASGFFDSKVFPFFAIAH